MILRKPEKVKQLNKFKIWKGRGDTYMHEKGLETTPKH